MYQKITIVGRLGKDPEMRFMPNGDAVTNMSVAVSERKKDGSGSYNEHTTWIRVVVWGKQAENCHQYLAKGKLVLVEGSLKSDANGNPSTFTRSDGSAGASFEVTAHTVKFLSPAGGNGGGSNSPVITPVDEDDPF